MNTYERIINAYMDIEAVYDLDNHRRGHDDNRYPKWQILKRIQEMGSDGLTNIRKHLSDGHRPIWHQLTIDRLAVKICRRLYPDRFVDGAVTPLGLCSRMQISFVKNHLRDWREREDELRITDATAAKALYDERFSGDNSIGFTIEPRDLADGKFAIVDYTTDMKSFPLGTIGFLNGMNHPGIPIPKNVNLEYFRQWVR